MPQHFREILEGGVDTMMDLWEHFEKMYELLAKMAMKEEVEALCGDRCKHDKVHGGRYKRWGSNPGSIQIEGERIKVRVPRVRDVKAGEERPLETYRRFRRPTPEEKDKVADAILLRLSQRDYQRTACRYANSFGLSASSISRTFQERSAAALEAFEQRNLTSETYVALLLDGKHLRGQQIVLCVGITDKGEKRVLGFVETTTENAEAITGLLQDLLARGLHYAEGLLCVIDGAKGMRTAVKNVFGDHAQVQRCTWHKRENVVGHLKNKGDRIRVRRTMRRAYGASTYQEAKQMLEALQEELRPQERQAANSLVEGMEETLTLHRLGLASVFGRSLQTTNIIENVNSHIGRRTRRVTRWVNSYQRQRWVAMAIRETEPRLGVLRCAEHLPKLQKALSESVSKPYLSPTSNRLRF